MVLFDWIRTLNGASLRRLAVHAFAIAGLLFPLLYLALDHHAGERMPEHGHLVLYGEPVPPHVHGFEILHEHDVTTPFDPDRVLSGTVVLIDSALSLAMTFVQATSIAFPTVPLFLLTLALAGALPLKGGGLQTQILFAPPLRPPSRARSID